MSSNISPKNNKYEWLRGRRIEIQRRSRLQHAWASAVETVDSIFEEDLKLGGGTEEWKRFFQLSASAIALREGCPSASNTPGKAEELVSELRAISEKLDVFQVLDAVTVTVTALNFKETADKFAWRKPVTDKPPAWYLLRMDVKEKTVGIAAFAEDELELARETYATEEKKALPDSIHKQVVVLVSVEKLDDLKRAYPSYYLDSQAFLDALGEAIK